MSLAITSIPGRQVAAAALAIGIVLALSLPAPAQAPRETDPLDQVRRLNEVAAQRMEAEVRDALADAQRWSATDPERAIVRLRRVLDRLENDTALAATRREALKRMVRDRIRLGETDADRARLRQKETADKLLIKSPSRKAEEERQTAENVAINRTLHTISALRKEGKTAEADRLANDLAQKYPDHPAAMVARRSTSAAEQLATTRELNEEKGRRFVGVIREIERSALPPVGVIEYPKDWAQKTAKRKAGVTLTAKEQAILKALNMGVTVNFKDQRFEDVIEYLATLTGQPILLDKRALDEAMIGYDTPVTANVKNVTVRTLLRKILNEHGLAYVIKDESIQVTSELKAKSMLIARAYPVADLIGGGPAFGVNPLLNQFQMMQNVTQLIDLIQNTIDPQSWQVNGGPGTISFHAPTMSLIVRQSAELHAVLGSGFYRGN